MEGFQKTEIGLLPKDWSAARIKEMYKLNNEQITQSNIPYKEFYYIDLSSVKNGVVSIPQDKILVEEAPSRAKRVLRQNDVILATVRPNLKGFAIANFDTNKMICSTGFALVKTKNELDAQYLFQNLFSHNITNQIENLVVGSNYPAISNSDVENLIIPKPPLPEQQKIAAILSKWDETIEAQSQLIEAKEKLKQGLMQKLLSGEVRFPGHTDTWGNYVLGEIGEFKNGINKSKEDFGFGKPFVNLLDIFGKPILKPGNFAMVNATDKECEQFNLLSGDVLFVRSSIKPSGVGLTTIIEEDLIETVYSGFIIRYRHQPNVFDNVFKRYCFLEESFRNQLISKSSTSANTNINQENLKTLRIKIPSITEQNKISSFLTCLDTEIESLKIELESLKLQKKGLMQELLTGKIRVKV